MDFDPVWNHCFDMTNSEFYAFAAPYVAVCALAMVLGLQMLLRRQPARLLSLKPPSPRQ